MLSAADNYNGTSFTAVVLGLIVRDITCAFTDISGCRCFCLLLHPLLVSVCENRGWLGVCLIHNQFLCKRR